MFQRFLVLALVCIPLTVTAASKIYTWTDENGDTFYGDRPPKEAEATEIAVQGKKKSPVNVNEEALPGVWFGYEENGGEVKLDLKENGTITLLQTKSDQSVFNYQGIWSYTDNSITVITEFSQTAPRNGDFKRSVEPLQLVYNIIRFEDGDMELIISDERFSVSKTN
jgi:hypothetical protein